MASSEWEVIQNEPLTAPPPGVSPNFVNPPSLVFEMRIAAGICISLIVLFGAIRAYAKLFILKMWTWDDLKVIFGLGWCAGITYISITVAIVNMGIYGKHEWDSRIGDYTAHQLQLDVASEGLYGPFIWFVKLSLFVLYVQVFRPLRWLRYLAYAGAIVSGLFYSTMTIIYVVFCAPRHGSTVMAYLTTLQSPRCSQWTSSIVIILGVANLASDLFLLVLPLPAVWHLHASLRRKLAISTMFMTGAIACVASAIALAYRILQTKAFANDATWIIVPLGVAVDVEFAAGIIVCCMPSTAQVSRQLWKSTPSIKSSYYKALRSIYRSSTSASHELSRDAKLQHKSRGHSYDSHETLKPGVGFPVSEWKSEYEMSFTPDCKDGNKQQT